MLVSIGLPFYNNVQTLRSAVQSVMAQTFQDWELLLVDDGSSDGSLQIAQAVTDPRVIVISDGVNRGLPYRLNQIARLAKGKYLARMDADDLMHPEHLEQQVKFLDNNLDVHLVSTGAYVIDANNNPVGIRGMSPLDTSPRNILARALMIHPTVTGRTEWFRRHPYDPSFPRAEDHELWCRTYSTSVFANINKPLFFYREVGVFSLGNYLASCKTDRKIFRVYGPEMVGLFGTLEFIGKSYAKAMLYQILTRFGAEDVLIKRRSAGLSEDEKLVAKSIIDRILVTPVPETVQ